MVQLLASLAAGFAVGAITRFFLERNSRRKLLKMENDMLKNHSRILALQQKISFMEIENSKLAKQ
jgi:hypothetical protein